jgi:hypothetical protein
MYWLYYLLHLNISLFLPYIFVMPTYVTMFLHTRRRCRSGPPQRHPHHLPQCLNSSLFCEAHYVSPHPFARRRKYIQCLKLCLFPEQLQKRLCNYTIISVQMRVKGHTLLPSVWYSLTCSFPDSWDKTQKVATVLNLTQSLMYWEHSAMHS